MGHAPLDAEILCGTHQIKTGFVEIVQRPWSMYWYIILRSSCESVTQLVAVEKLFGVPIRMIPFCLRVIDSLFRLLLCHRSIQMLLRVLSVFVVAMLTLTRLCYSFS
jgi:hypothetical protein